MGALPRGKGALPGGKCSHDRHRTFLGICIYIYICVCVYAYIYICIVAANSLPEFLGFQSGKTIFAANKCGLWQRAEFRPPFPSQVVQSPLIVEAERKSASFPLFGYVTNRGTQQMLVFLLVSVERTLNHNTPMLRQTHICVCHCK